MKLVKIKKVIFSRFVEIKNAVLSNGFPKTIKVAIWVGVSAGLTYLINNVAQLHLDVNQQFILLGILNSVLAGLNEVKKNV